MIENKTEILDKLNENIKLLKETLTDAGVDKRIIALNVKNVYENFGIHLEVDLESSDKYFDTRDIALQLSMYTRTGGPAFNAIGAIIKSHIQISDDEQKIMYVGKTDWNGTISKYTVSVIDKIKQWLDDKGYPNLVAGQDKNGKVKNYVILYSKPSKDNTNNKTKSESKSNNDNRYGTQLDLFKSI